MRWKEYNTKKDLSPSPTVQRALEHLKDTDFRDKLAIDLGCGNGRDTIFLLEKGWTVYAIDSSPETIEIVEANVPPNLKKSLLLGCTAFSEFNWCSTQLVNASFSLPFCDKRKFPIVWRNIVNSIESGGIFTGNFFGINDDWKSLFLVEKEEIARLFQDFEIVYFEEKEFDKRSFKGPEKHWHIFEITAKKT